MGALEEFARYAKAQAAALSAEAIFDLPPSPRYAGIAIDYDSLSRRHKRDGLIYIFDKGTLHGCFNQDRTPRDRDLEVLSPMTQFVLGMADSARLDLEKFRFTFGISSMEIAGVTKPWSWHQDGFGNASYIGITRFLHSNMAPTAIAEPLAVLDMKPRILSREQYAVLLTSGMLESMEIDHSADRFENMVSKTRSALPELAANKRKLATVARKMTSVFRALQASYSIPSESTLQQINFCTPHAITFRQDDLERKNTLTRYLAKFDMSPV